MDVIEGRLEWKIEALQECFVEASKYTKWKDDQAYEEEEKAYHEEEIIEHHFRTMKID